MRRHTKAAIAASLFAVGVSATVSAYSTYARWSSASATFYVNPNNMDVTQSAAIAAVQAGLDVWNTQSASAFRYQYGGTVTDTATANDNRNVIIFRNSTNSSNASALATTYSWWNSSGQLVDADIVVWDGAFTFFTGTSGCVNGAYIEDILAHELGHALGLNHSTVADATMYPSYSYCSQELRTLAADDIAAAQSLYPGGGTSTNTAPSVSITSPGTGTSFAEGTSISFTGSASDKQDGNLTNSLQWTDNGTAFGSGGSLSTTLPAGSHSIVAWVTDTGNLQASKSVSITVSAAAVPPPPSSSTGSLSAKGRKVKALEYVDLTWNGLSASSLDIYRNSVKVMNTANDGAQTDSLNKKGAGTYNYKVCETGTTNCSNTATVVF